MTKRIIMFIAIAAGALLVLASAPNARGPQAKAQAAVVATGLGDGWSTPVNISKQGGSSELPYVAVDNSGKAYATWTEWFGGVGAPRAMMFNTNISGQWPDSQGAYLFYPNIDDVGFPAIACHPTNGTAWVAYHDGDFSVGKMGIMFKQYASGTLTHEQFIPGVGGSSSYVTLAYNPVDNMVYAVFMDDVTDDVIFQLAIFFYNPVTRAWDGGNAIGGITRSSRYWPYLTFDKNGTAHLVYIARSPAQVWYLKNATPQNVNTWTAPVNISGDTALDWTVPRIAADKDGDVYVVWYANTGGYQSATEEVIFRKTVNGVWQTPENLSNSPYRSEGASIAVDPETKDIFLAYQELVGGTNWEVFLRAYTSPPGGGPKTWSSIVNMTNNPNHSGEPSLKLDPLGGLHLVYHDVIGGNWEIMYTNKPGISLAVTSPNGGESWQAYTSHPITWTTLGTVNNVKLEYSTNGGASYTTIVASTANTGSYTWLVPNAPSANCLVRVSEATTGSPADASDAAFTIAPSPITLTSPSGGDNWQATTSRTITWTTQGVTVNNAKIEYSTNGGASYTTIVASTSNTGSYTWGLPNTSSTNCLVKVSEASTGIPSGTSGTFTISPSPISVTAPAGGEAWQAFTPQTIRWTYAATGVNVKIELSTDGGANFSTIAAAAANTGSYAWTVANSPGANCYIRVSEATTGRPHNTNAAAFTISAVPKPKTPLTVAVDTRLNDAEDKKINKITWAANPENAFIPLTKHNVYRKPKDAADASFVLIGSPAATVFLYEDANLDVKAKLAYRVTAVSITNLESDPSTTVEATKKFEFPPVNLTLTTAINKILFAEQKYNTVTWASNDLNEAAEVSGYELYRRKIGESDDLFVLITTPTASVFSYRDGKLPSSQKYAYALRTRFSDNRLSKLSPAISEK